LGAFFAGPAEPKKTAKKVLEIAKSFKEQYPDKALGVIGVSLAPFSYFQFTIRLMSEKEGKGLSG